MTSQTISPRTTDIHLHALAPGFRLPGFTIIRLLSLRGGFGLTYLAQDMALPRIVVVKEFFPSYCALRLADGRVVAKGSAFADAFARGQRAFQREGEALAKLSHPNIVKVITRFEHNQTAYLVMDHVDGAPLEEWAARTGAVTPDSVRALLLHLLDALRHAHAQDVIHSDIKPQNVILKADGTPVLIDFGASRRIGSTLSMNVVSEAYSPPEAWDPQVEGAPTLDIFSLAASLYFLITGAPPPEANRRAARKTDPYRPVSRLQSRNWPAPLLKAVDRSLALDPVQRPQTVDALEALLAGRTGHATGAACGLAATGLMLAATDTLLADMPIAGTDLRLGAMLLLLPALPALARLGPGMHAALLAMVGGLMLSGLGMGMVAASAGFAIWWGLLLARILRRPAGVWRWLAGAGVLAALGTSLAGIAGVGLVTQTVLSQAVGLGFLAAAPWLAIAGANGQGHHVRP